MKRESKSEDAVMGTKEEKTYEYILKCASIWFSSALVTHVKGLIHLNKETQSEMTFKSQHLLRCLLKTVYNAEQSMTHK